MRNLQCLIADIPQAILADILQRSAEQSERIEVVERVANLDDLPEALAQNSIDVLIVGMEKPAVPKVYSDLMHQFANLLVVGLIDDGRSAAVFVNDISSKQMTELITLLGKR